MGALLHDVGPYEIFVLVSDVFCEPDFAYVVSITQVSAGKLFEAVDRYMAGE